jgi:histidine decarboxylase
MQYELTPSDNKLLDELRSELSSSEKHMLGYPINCATSVNEIHPFLDFVINNLGDPFAGSCYKLNTFKFEKEVLSFFAELFHAPEGWWGYVTNGGSESNFRGLSMGCAKYKKGFIIHSESSHYSVGKVVSAMKNFTSEMHILEKGHISLRHIGLTLDWCYPEHPPIFNMNIGTTMTGAIDDVEGLVELLEEKKVDNFYIHCDAALSGLMLPFIEDTPKFDFRLPVDSIAISGHKFLGCPIPCGVVICREKPQGDKIEYINSVNSTISGSRSGIASLALWCILKKYGKKGIQEMVNHCMGVASYAKLKLKEIEWQSWSNPFSNTIVIERPSEEVIEKWQLATEGKWSHIITMPHVTRNMINDFICDLKVS